MVGANGKKIPITVGKIDEITTKLDEDGRRRKTEKVEIGRERNSK